MEDPVIVELVSGYDFIWEQSGVRVEVRRIDVDRRDIKAELTIYYTSIPAQLQPQFVKRSNLNLLADSTRNTLADRLQKSHKEHVDWDRVIEVVTNQTIELFRRGGELERVDPFRPSLKPPEYLVKPLILKNQPNILVGFPGSFKSFTAAALTFCCMLPWQDNPMGWRTPSTMQNVLILTWEEQISDVDFCMRRMINGMSLAAIAPYFRKCKYPIFQMEDTINYYVDKVKPDLIIIDSLGPAVGGDLNAPEPAFKFFGVLSRLNVTTLTIAHPAKNTDENAKLTVFGSQFYTAEARNIWESQRVENPNPSEATIIFHQRKTPQSFGKYPEMGMKIKFIGDGEDIESSAIISRCNPEDEPDGLRKMSNSKRIEAALKDMGKMTTLELSTELCIDKDIVRVELNRLHDKNVVYKLENKTWGLAAYV
ncbi:MAG: AAA family ATPase [Dehalococcoidia bacterium]|nr:AAA family ATPase [Dehalococcoidia bacterium]